VGDFVAVNPSSRSEFWIAEVRECFLEMMALEVVWWTRFRKDGKSLIRKDQRAYQRDDGHHSSVIRVDAVFGILEDYELGTASENATSFMKNSKNDRGLKEKHKPGDEGNESSKPTLIIGKKELERLRCMAKKHGMHCARACRRRVRATSSESSDESSSDRNFDYGNSKTEERDASTRKRPRVSTSQAAFTNTYRMSNPMEAHLREIVWCIEKLLNTSHRHYSLEDQIGWLTAIIEEAATAVDVLLSRAASRIRE